MSDSSIPLSIPHLAGNESAYLQDCLDTNFVSSVGPYVGRFEDAFAKTVGSPYAVACSCGTAAIHVALQIAGVERNDEVWVSDFSFIATVNPIAYLGAIPVLVDAEASTWNLDPDLVADELHRRRASGKPLPKAVLAAHILGIPAKLLPILEACAELDIPVIEDAAESLGSYYREGSLAGRWVGTVGRLGCFSFNGNKILTTGGGGMIVSADRELAGRAKHLTTQARLPGEEYLHDEIGYNYRLTNLAAALGVAQLEQLPSFLQRKLDIARRYDDAFRDVEGVTPHPRPAGARGVPWLYSILLDPQAVRIDRRVLMRELDARDIQSRPIWLPAHCMSMYSKAPRLGGAVGERLHDHGLSLPSSVSLGERDQDRVIQAVLTALKG